MATTQFGPLYFELNTGAKIPSVGLGTWRAPPGEVEKAVIAAVKAGYRHMDCAWVYGNEKAIGEALKQLFDDGVVKRSELFITSKLWCSDHSAEDVDLYLKHAMEGLYESGKARAIGVCNFSTKKLQDLLALAKVLPAVNQVACNVNWQQPELHKYCKSVGIHVSAYSPLGSPGTWINAKCLKEPILLEIAEILNKSPAQVALRWCLQSGHSVPLKSVNELHIKENIDLFSWSIPEDLFNKFSGISQLRRVCGDFAVHPTGPITSVEEIWDGEL